MARVKRGVTTRAKHKRILVQAKGYYGRRKNTIRIARQAVEKAGQYAYRDRKVKKRTFRGLWIQRINAGVRAEEIDEQRFAGFLYTAGQPDPDLLIRTSGEMRVSNFLLWQAAYSELVFTDTLWPDFSEEDLQAALDEFERRGRRFGAR